MNNQDILKKHNVTDEQVSMAHRIVNLNTHQVFYQVESQSEVGVEYTVYYHQVLKHLVCDCKAGQNGIPCWHKRAALAHSDEIRRERREQQERDMRELQAEIDAESKAYTVQVDPTSSSLDGVKFEQGPSGKMVPMR